MRFALAAAVVLAAVAVPRGALCQTLSGVFTYRYDNSRSGQNPNETILTPENVNVSSFGTVFSRDVDGAVYAQPLYVRGVQIPSVGTRNVVYVATQHDSVYAFDATGERKAPFWKRTFTDPANGVTPVSHTEVGTADIAPEIGITGTPVIDPSSATLYAVAKTSERGEYVQRLHALDLATGKEKFGGPAVIEASVPGTGDGSAGTGTIEFNALVQNQRAALLLNDGILYVAFGSHGDNGPYHGWVLAFDANTLAPLGGYNTTPGGKGGGIWMSGGGPASDDDGNIFVSVGNGTFDAHVGGNAVSNSFLKLTNVGGKLNLVDYFTPFNQAELSKRDLDLGSAGPLLLPDQPLGPPHLLIGAGKDGTIYLVNRDNMGRFHDEEESPNAHALYGATTWVFGTPAYFNGMVYFIGASDPLTAFVMQDGQLSSIPIAHSSVKFGHRGASPIVSGDGLKNGVVWAIDNNRRHHATLRAFDASNVSSELYESDQAGTRDRLDTPVVFAVPTVADGRVYVGTQKRLTVFGLLGRK